MSSSHSSSSDTIQNTRKRVHKACDRCRLKKSKCNTSHPCTQCKNDNLICIFNKGKKSRDRVYPKGYTEMLEQQQEQLVTGLLDIYERLISGKTWPGPLLERSSSGQPLVHDIHETLHSFTSATKITTVHKEPNEPPLDTETPCTQEVGSLIERRSRGFSERLVSCDAPSELRHPKTPANSPTLQDTTPRNFEPLVTAGELSQVQKQATFQQLPYLEYQKIGQNFGNSSRIDHSQNYVSFSLGMLDEMGSVIWDNSFEDFISAEAVEA